MHIKARVKAGAGKDSVEKIGEDTFRISVRARAEGNTANDRAVVLLARHLGVDEKRVSIVRGRAHSSKVLFVRNLSQKSCEDSV